MATPGRGRITSTRNPLIREIARLRERRERDRSGQFPVEGFREVAKAIAAGTGIEFLTCCETLFTDAGTDALVEEIRARGIEIVEMEEAPFRRISYRDRPDGILAVARTMDLRLDQVELQSPALILVVEAIEKPGNLGALLRACDGVGADAVIVADGVTDIYNPNVVRASLGTLFSRPVVQCSGEDALAWLRMRGVRIVATSPDADLPYTAAEMVGDVAVIVGAENRGLSGQWLDGADLCVSIPMAGSADSLNVAMAATLVMYEALRQRASEH